MAYLYPDQTDAEMAIGPAWHRARSGMARVLLSPMTLVLFVVCVLTLLLVLTRHEQEQIRNGLKRDTLWVQQTVRLHFQSGNDFLRELAREIGDGEASKELFYVKVAQHVANNPEVINVSWAGADARIIWSAPQEQALRPVGTQISSANSLHAFSGVRDSGQIAYSPPFDCEPGLPCMEVHVPIHGKGRFLGTLLAVYSMEGITHHQIPPWFAERYKVAIIGDAEQVLASASGGAYEGAAIYQDVPFDPLQERGIRLRVTAYDAGSGLGRNLLIMAVLVLTLLIIGSIVYLRREVQNRRQAESALKQESSFRKAMEDSLLTGVRAIDMSGRITHVNPAFCRLTGYSEGELLGAIPPFPYWPQEELPVLRSAFEATLAGQAPSTGFELRIMKKTGERIDVLSFISPLVDAQGRQTGWMASVSDITERKRAREQWRTTLEGLDAAVYVADMRTDELLYANRYFRAIYGDHVLGRNCWEITRPCQPETGVFCAIDGSAQESELPRELFDGVLQNTESGRWFHVRDRAIRWVDGRVVRLEVATDITAQRQLAEKEREQEERTQRTSRLITMGEMASSLAHELNQPLGAIANYCSGSVKRLSEGNASAEELLGAMQKASQQAERAGKIIRRVRDFVKKNEPQRQACDVRDIIDEALGFAELQAKRSNTRIRVEMGADVPLVLADRIMIEQVLLNLVKNGIEAMQACGDDEREVVLRARQAGGMVELAVTDRGCGIPPALRENLFSPFFSTKPEGMGMGLNICRSIIELHGGHLWLEDNPERGSVFSFTLPIEGGRMSEKTRMKDECNRLCGG